MREVAAGRQKSNDFVDLLQNNSFALDPASFPFGAPGGIPPWQQQQQQNGGDKNGIQNANQCGGGIGGFLAPARDQQMDEMETQKDDSGGIGGGGDDGKQDHLLLLNNNENALIGNGHGGRRKIVRRRRERFEP